MLAYRYKVIKSSKALKVAVPMGRNSTFNIHLLQMELEGGWNALHNESFFVRLEKLELLHHLNIARAMQVKGWSTGGTISAQKD